MIHNSFRCFNSSPEVIRLAVMLYIRYPLSLRQVEDILFEWGIDVCYEMVRYGGTALVRCLQPRSGHAAFVIDLIRTGAGILMRCLSASTARHAMCGVLSITKAKSLRLLPRNGGIAGLRLSS